MESLIQLYNRIQNPLDDLQNIERIITAWANANENLDFYNGIMRMNGRQDDSSVNLQDRETFYVKAYNEYIERRIELLKQTGKRNIVEGLLAFGKIKTMSDIDRLRQSGLFPFERYEIHEGGWEHIFSTKKRTGEIEGINENNVKHRLYVACQKKDMYRLMDLFRTGCEEQEVPYYFKAPELSGKDKSSGRAARDDTIVIYTNTQYLSEHIRILEEIGKEHPEIVDNIGRPPALTGRVNNWIGIGDEPNNIGKKKDAEKKSYNDENSDIIYPIMLEMVIDDILEHKGKNIQYNGQEQSFGKIFINFVAEQYIKKLSRRADFWFKDYGISKEELGSEKLKTQMIAGLRKGMTEGLKKTKEARKKMNVSNVLFIPTRNGKGIELDAGSMEEIIKKFTPILLEVNPELAKKVQVQLKEGYIMAGRDPEKFCFNNTTKKDFMEQDKINPQSNQTKNTPTPKDRLTGILESINPELLKKRLKLPNGAEIPAKQYIAEAILPYIPESGEFVLKSNNRRIPAKQFIEEAVFSVGQEKYNGDIKALLEALTVTDTETTKNPDNNTTRNKKMTPATGISQAESEQRKKDEDAVTRAEKQMQQRNASIQSQNNQISESKKRMSSKILKRNIIESKITETEKNEGIKKAREAMEIARLKSLKRQGKALSQEENERLIRYEAIRTQARLQRRGQFMNKSHGIGR